MPTRSKSALHLGLFLNYTALGLGAVCLAKPSIPDGPFPVNVKASERPRRRSGRPPLVLELLIVELA